MGLSYPQKLQCLQASKNHPFMNRLRIFQYHESQLSVCNSATTDDAGNVY